MTHQFAPTNMLRGPECESVRKTQEGLLREADEALGRSRGGLSTKVASDLRWQGETTLCPPHARPEAS
jgi:hypothetical protein